MCMRCVLLASVSSSQPHGETGLARSVLLPTHSSGVSCCIVIHSHLVSAVCVEHDGLGYSRLWSELDRYLC